MAEHAKLQSWQHPLGQDIWVFEKLLMKTRCANKGLDQEKSKLVLIKALQCTCWCYLWLCSRFVENGNWEGKDANIQDRTEEEASFFPTWYVFSFLVLFAPSLPPSSIPRRGGTGCFPESL